MGIPRLKFPADAPSRSTLKLEEALHVFIPADEWDERLANGMYAVDLGPARADGPISWLNATCGFTPWITVQWHKA
jgi:23S rRNA C2498 (ribose-2'-O)-methylase RlmM